jgi:ABC-type nitrate/sulfonate/bicarbonate transport system ATPase subunit
MQRLGKHVPVVRQQILNNAAVGLQQWKQDVSRRMLSSGMWRRVNLVRTDISEERIASIFRVEKFAREEPA